MRGATFLSVLHALSIRNFNPRSSCEERHGKTSLLWQMAKISIHAPHARSDDPWIDALVSWTKISIHAPHARSDDILDTFGALEDTFQSTLLMRGATCRGGNDAGCEHDFNPRSSCEERRLSTRKRLQSSGISIHAPHARSDGFCISKRRKTAYFNPRSSCEERLSGSIKRVVLYEFQSTLLMRGATPHPTKGASPL